MENELRKPLHFLPGHLGLLGMCACDETIDCAKCGARMCKRAVAWRSSPPYQRCGNCRSEAVLPTAATEKLRCGVCGDEREAPLAERYDRQACATCGAEPGEVRPVPSLHLGPTEPDTGIYAPAFTERDEVASALPANIVISLGIAAAWAAAVVVWFW